MRLARATAPLVAVLVTLVFVSCGSDSAAERAKLAKLAEGCLLDSDCASPLVCAFKSCHTRCNDSRDCPAAQVCVPAEPRPYNVCLHSPDKCFYNTDCPADNLFCAKDLRCRLQCKSDRDCLPEQTCVTGACADEKDLTDGQLVPPDGPSPDASVGTSCTYNSDCDAPLVCIAGSCLVECKGDRDCAPGLLCDTVGSCVLPGQSDGGVAIPSCVNGKQDQGETGIDCGGGCGKCDGDPCSKPLDCASNVCQGLICQAPSCGDGLQNGVESDVDCGGSCPKCPPTKGCWTKNDCTTASCVGGSCNAPGCSNGSKDTNETDVDCGGTECKPCATGKGCEKNGDCTSQNCVAKKCVNAGPTLWTRVINGSGSEDIEVAAAGAGHVVMAGEFTKGQPGVDFGGGGLISSGTSLYVAKHTLAGAHSWSRSLGASTYLLFGDVAVAPGGEVWVWAEEQLSVPLPGALPSCTSAAGKWVGKLVKLDGSTGADVFSTCSSIVGGGGQIRANAVHADAQGDVWVSGFFYGTADFDGTQITTPYTNGFVAKYSKVSGVAAWVNHIRNNSAPPGSLVAQGQVTDFSSDATHTYAVGFLRQDVTIGTGTPVALTKTGSQDDIFVVKMDSTGAVVASRTFGSSGPDIGMRIAVAGSDVWIAGTLEGQVSFGPSQIVTAAGGRDVFVARLSAADLSAQWAQGYGGTADEDLGGFDVSATGEFAITGSIRSAYNFGGGPLPYSAGEDFFLARFSSSGVHQSSQSAGGLAKEAGLSAAYVGSSLYVGGKYGSAVTIDFGNGPLPTPSGEDAFVVFFP